MNGDFILTKFDVINKEINLQTTFVLQKELDLVLARRELDKLKTEKEFWVNELEKNSIKY